MSTVLEMLRASPQPPFADDRLLAECIALCFECAQTCSGCADACLGERDVDRLRRCIRLTLDCADATAATGRILSRPHEPDLMLLRRLLEVCALHCGLTADECGRFQDRFDHCRLARETCRRCAEACNRLRQAIERLPAEATTRH